MIAPFMWAVVLSWWDVKHRTLPNWMTLGGAAVALVMRCWSEGGAGVVDGLAGGAVAGAFLLLPFLMRGAGGGDVKMLFAAGTMVGWGGVLYLLWYMSLAGLVLAVVMLALKQTDGARLQHYVRCLVDWRYDRQAGAAALLPKENDRARMPFSIAIGVGLVLTMMVNL
jgi:prepilin peptidase CpaA